MLAETRDVLLTEFTNVGADDLITTLGTIRQSLLEMRDSGMSAAVGFGETKKQLMEYTDWLYTVRRAQTAMRTEFRVTHADLIEGARVLQDVGAIGRTVVSMWQAYTLAQTRVADAARDIREAQGDVVIIQDALNRSMRSGDLEQQMELTLKLSHAKTAAAEASQALTKAQNDNIIGYIGMGLQMGSILGRLPTMALHITVLQGLMAAKAAATIADNVGMAASIPLMAAQDTLLVAQTGARWTSVAAIQAESAALAIRNALAGPIGWAILGGAAIAGGAYLMSQNQTRSMTIDYHPTVYGGMAGLAEDRDEFVDSLRRQGVAP